MYLNVFYIFIAVSLSCANNVYLNQWKTLHARVMIESFDIEEDVQEDFSLKILGDLGSGYIKTKVKDTTVESHNLGQECFKKIHQ